MRAGSSTEKALARALAGAAAAGARTHFIGGPELEMPLYAPDRPSQCERAVRLVAELRRADGIVLGSPSYHGGISGLVKNALDYTEELRDDARPYFDGRAVGCVATGAGWQGSVNTLTHMRCIVHALRGWNTPIGIALNSAEPLFDAAGACVNDRDETMLELMGGQIVAFARGYLITAPPA